MRYGEFYDVPHSFLVEHGGATYFFDSPFDDSADDYADHYRVYRLAPKAAATAELESWTDLAHGAAFVGEVPIAAICFDPMRRAAIDDAVFGLLDPG
jgi:hypothetical protein